MRVRKHTPREWCDYYGVEVKSGVAILFKAVDDNYSTRNAMAKGIFYQPGKAPTAPDWNGDKTECGGGLHFSPTPAMAREFNPDAKHFIACPVKLNEIVVHPNGSYPQKVKAKRVFKPCFEVNKDGERISKGKTA